MTVGLVTTLLIKGGHVDRFAAQLGDTLDRPGGFRRKEDHALRAPRPALAVGGVAQRQRLTSGSAHLLELAVCEEPQIFGLRRPEWVLRAFSAGQNARLHLVEISDEDPHLAVGVRQNQIFSKFS